MKTRNIGLDDFRRYLHAMGCVLDRTSSGHEVWAREGLTRPIILQTHVDPVPEQIVKNSLKALGVSKAKFDLKITPKKD